MGQKHSYPISGYIREVLDFLAQRQNQFFEKGGKDETEISFGVTVKHMGPILKEVNKGCRKENPFLDRSLERVFQHLKNSEFIKPLKKDKHKFFVSPSAYRFLGIERITKNNKDPQEEISPSLKEKASEVKEYQPKNLYEVGDIIYHRVWQEEGKVMEKGITTNGYKMILVSFLKVGIKKLVIDCSLDRVEG